MRGSVVKREGKRGTSWFVVLRGKWYRCPQPTKRAAELYRAQLLAALEHGDLVLDQEDVDLASFAQRWLTARSSELATHSLSAYSRVLRTMILPHLGQRRLHTLTAEDCHQWRAKVLATHSPRTVGQAIAVLKNILSTAVDWRVLRSSPTGKLRAPRVAAESAQVLTGDQVAAVLRVAVAPDHRAMVLLAVTGGLRVGEVAAARWENLNLEERYYQVTGTGYDDHGGRVGQPKTRGSVARVMLSPACCDALRRQRAALAEVVLAHRWVDRGFMFLGATGNMVRPHTLQILWAKIAKLAGLPPCTFHVLRHTCASLLIDRGAHPKIVQAQLRHATIQMTFDVYGHLFPGRVDEAVANLDSVIGAAVSI